MSKNLEAEYKRIMNDQIPDLWARIEAGIENDPRPVSEEPAVRTPVRPVTPSAAPVRRRFLKPFIGVAAAAACVCIVVPLALSLGGGHAAESSVMTAEALPGEASPANEALQAAAAAAAPEAAADEEYAMDDAAAEEAYYEDAAPFEAAEEPYEYEAAEEIAVKEAAAEEPAVYEEAAALGGEAKAEAAGEPAASEVLYGVTFKIASVPEEDASGKLQAVILSCPDDPSLDGTSVILTAADPQTAAEAGFSEPPSLPAEAGTFTGILMPSADEDGSPVYALLSF